MGVRRLRELPLGIAVLCCRPVLPSCIAVLYCLSRRFADSDTLWAGLVRGVFRKVEERVAAGKHPRCGEYSGTGKHPRKGNYSGTQEDFKRNWRVKRAKKELTDRFGLLFIRRIIALAAVVLFALIALIVMEATGYTRTIEEIHASFSRSVESALAVITGLTGALVAIVPSIKLAFASSKESHVCRGDEIFKEAKMVKDQLGFLAKVKGELQELFDYLRQFEKGVKTQIVLVPIVDDLDRCITGGRNVKVLEAMQMILSVPGAPILSFLAVDSRIVVASIEDHYEKVFAKTHISGHEYLDKIVQLPFALPEPSSDKVERLLSKSLEGDAASLALVSQQLKAFAKYGRKILTETKSKQITFFKIAQTKVTTEKMVRLEPLVVVIEGYDEHEKLDSKQALSLVCSAAEKLGEHLKDCALRIDQMETDDVRKEAVAETLCFEINLALESGTFDFEEVHCS
jgi:hypothetical protein